MNENSNAARLGVVINSKLRLIIYVFIGILILLNLFTLNVSPLPWYDEVDFASISKSYHDTGRFICTANDLYFAKPHTEVLYYGPVYFVLNSIIIKYFGFGMVQMRILNFFAGLGCIYFFVAIYNRMKQTSNSYARLFLPLLLITDYTFIQDMHSGRMDLVALAFVLTAMLLLLKKIPGYGRFVIAGILAAMGLLTTPRVYFIIIAMIIYFGWLAYKNKNLTLFKGGLLAGTVCVGIYFFWIQKAFGDLYGYLQYLNQAICYFDGASGDFFVPNFSIPYHQLVIISLAGLIFITGLVVDYKTTLIVQHLFFLIAIVLFVFFVGGSEINFCLISGFIYLLIINIFQENKAAPYLLSVLLMMNVGLISYKFFYVLRESDQRSPAAIFTWIKKEIPSNSKVVADDKYYYSVVNSGSSFQYYLRSCDNITRAKYQKEVWKADYLLVEDTSSQFFKDYRKIVSFVFIDKFQRKSGINNRNYSNSYEGYLFKFVR